MRRISSPLPSCPLALASRRASNCSISWISCSNSKRFWGGIAGPRPPSEGHAKCTNWPANVQAGRRIEAVQERLQGSPALARAGLALHLALENAHGPQRGQHLVEIPGTLIPFLGQHAHDQTGELFGNLRVIHERRGRLLVDV